MNVQATRRRFFSFAGGAVGAARVTAEKVASELSGVSLSGGMSLVQGISSSSDEPTSLQTRLALANPFTRRTVEALIYQEERSPSRIDPDLAVLKSVSFSAKVTLQRQRNVKARLAHMEHGWPWLRITNTIKDALGMK